MQAKDPSHSSVSSSADKDISCGVQLMAADFRDLVESLEPKHQALVGMAPVKYGTLPRKLPIRGIYLFSEGANHRYVGRTNRMRERLRGHCAPSASHFTATFAFR